MHRLAALLESAQQYGYDYVSTHTYAIFACLPEAGTPSILDQTNLMLSSAASKSLA